MSEQHEKNRRHPDDELDEQARAETEAGIGVPIEAVEAWVESWDTADELPIPKAGKVR